MFPTRTTSTTGTLHVPPAAAAAPTTFGWATTAHAPTPAPAPVPAPVPAQAGEPPAGPVRHCTPSAASVPASAGPASPAGYAVPSPAPAGDASPPAPRAAAPGTLPTGQDTPAPDPASDPTVVSVPHPVPAEREADPEPASAVRTADAPLRAVEPRTVPAGAPAPLGAQAPSRAAEPQAGPGSRSGGVSGLVASAEGGRDSGPVSGFAPRAADAPLPAAAPAPPGAQASHRAAEPQAGTGFRPAVGPASAEPEALGAGSGAAEPQARTGSRATASASGPVSGSGPRAGEVSLPAAAPAPLGAQAPSQVVEPQGQTGSRSGGVAGRVATASVSGPVPDSALRAAPAPFGAQAPSQVVEPQAGTGSRPAGGPASAEPEGDRASGPVPDSALGAAPVPFGALAPSQVVEPQAGTGLRPAGGSASVEVEGDGVSGQAPPRAEGEADVAVPAARGQVEPEPVHEVAGAGAGHDAPATPRPRNPVPGPGVAEIVAQAVTRGMEEDDDTQDLPMAAAPHRGSAVTEVPVHLPFRATTSAPLPEPAPRPAPGPTRPARPAPGRRVPRGDDRLREHRGPVLPGWVGVAVGGLALAGCTAVLWRAGVVPAPLVAAFGAAPRAYHGLRATHWPPLAFLGIVALVALGGLGRARTGHAWVLTLFGRYRGTVRRTGLTWVSPLLLRRRVDVRLRHWRSDPMPAVDSGGLALQVVVQVVWQVKDTARATLAVADHTEYLAEQVESAMARVLSQLPADAFHEDAPTLRDAEAVGDALTRMLAAETEAVGIEVYSAQPTRIEYAPEVAEAMRRRRVAAIDAKHRDTVLTSVVDAVDDTVHRLTSRGLVELDDYERKALVKDLTVAFYTGRTE
ncbi:SPFH domain-containing protein [Streptomyces sp. XY58]|uniref:SPFH domain-containing protein n=1 Tax=Streptomyces sp. XY58 TaxID=1519482 RepID=UPI000AAC6C45|nr:SPFH domain-containing protein [Streptomyces sp. XY58]